MHAVRVEILGYVNDAQPGWVECRLTDARGCAWHFLEKVPVVTVEVLGPDSTYPQLGILGCQIIERRHDADGEVVVIDTEEPWHIESVTGETRFEVRPEQLEEFDRL